MNKSLTHSDLVRNWFRRTGGGGLVLADAWFGRPYDNIHRLTDITESPTFFRIVLDEHLSLTFHGNIEIRDEGDELTIGGYSRLAFDWKEYGSHVPHTDSFEGGEVKLVAPPSP